MKALCIHFMLVSNYFVNLFPLCSQLIKGLVFKKHAAHKHMPTNYKNLRLLLIHGSLELSSGGLSSFESMQQVKLESLLLTLHVALHFNIF